MEWIKQNLIDRGKALDNFMDRRRKIILKIQKIHSMTKHTHHWKQKMLLNVKRQQLFEQLERITAETEQRLTDIRNRRKELISLQNQSSHNTQ